MITRIALIARVHVAVLVALVRHRRADRQEFKKSLIGEPAKRPGWEADPDSLSGFWPVRVPENNAVDEPVQSGRHSKGEAA